MPLLNQPVGQLRRAERVVADNGVSGDKGVVEVQTDDGHFLPRQQLHIRGGQLPQTDERIDVARTQEIRQGQRGLHVMRDQLHDAEMPRVG